MPDGSPEPAETTEAPVGNPLVFLGLPHSGTMCPEAMVSLGLASKGKLDVQVEYRGSSLLAANFNGLWSVALNMEPRPNYFAMHHSDVAAPRGWLDRLVDTLEAEGADMVSACIALKDFNGLTSTALLDLETGKRRRLTITETLKLPEVFSAADVAELWGLPYPSQTALLANTGLWVSRFAGEEWIEGIHFETGDDIRRSEDGKFCAHVDPEDWLWSADLARRGLVVLCSRALPIAHYGRTAFAMGGDMKPWGILEADEWVAT